MAFRTDRLLIFYFILFSSFSDSFFFSFSSFLSLYFFLLPFPSPSFFLLVLPLTLFLIKLNPWGLGKIVLLVWMGPYMDLLEPAVQYKRRTNPWWTTEFKKREEWEKGRQRLMPECNSVSVLKRYWIGFTQDNQLPLLFVRNMFRGLPKERLLTSIL